MKQIGLITLLIVLIFAPISGLCATDPPFLIPDQPSLNRIRSGEIITSKGSIIFELYPESAPLHVANFKYLADLGFYRGLGFSVFQKNYVLQAGRPKANQAQPLWSLAPEFSEKKHLRGTLSMARLPDQKNAERRSHASQFNIVLSEAPHLDGNFTIFGRVVKGFTVIDQLSDADQIQDLKVYLSPR